jgi:hypothetical protein
VKTKLIPSFVVILLICGTLHAQEWSKYVPEKLRKDIFKKSAKTGGTGLALSGQAVIAIWVTEPMARVLVSEAIDRERLTPDAADLRYKALRPEKGYCFLMNTYRFGLGALGASVKDIGNPLANNETFLQRTDDRKRFSRSEIDDHQFDINLGGLFRPAGAQSTYRVNFQKEDANGQALVRDLADKMEIQFSLSGKKVVFEYKLKEMVSRLEDL